MDTPVQVPVPGVVYRDVRFYNEEIVVDGKRFEQCTFDNVSLVFMGDTLPQFVNCRFNAVSLEFLGGAANTLQLLSALSGGGFARAVGRITEGIRTAPAASS